MSLIKTKDLEAVSNAINQAELHTDAELVTVLARQADDYRYIPTLWAAVIALLVPGLVWLTGLWLNTLDVLWMQLAVFAVLALVFRVPWLMFRLVPASVRQRRAANLARYQFLENNLHHTKQSCGVLIFIAEAERYVEIIADQGIAQHVSQAQWQVIVAKFTRQVARKNTQQGLIECINSCGELLAQYAPATSQKNELSNHLVLI